MHRFAFFPSGNAKFRPDVSSAILLGADGVPVRGEIHVDGSNIVCESRNPDALALSILWPVDGVGTIQLETTRLPARDEPYHLNIELARHRLMRISSRREEWGLYDFPGMNGIATKVDDAQAAFVGAMQALPDTAAAAKLADRAIALAVMSSEEMCRFHAGVFLSRRKQSTSLVRGFFGTSVNALVGKTVGKIKLGDLFGFARIPFVWRDIQRKEQASTYDTHDALVKLCAKEGLPLRSGPLLNFGVQFIPDWMYIWENDYEAIAEFAKEHVRRTVQRYAGQISSWVVAGGLHNESVFPLNFEQIMELTRMAATITKQSAPRSQIVLELTQPWGECYARNPRTVPPLLYAEMATQSGISFDAFGLQLLFGIDSEGFHLRDQLQITSVIDRLANLGKPIQLTAVAYPSSGGKGGEPHGGWSEEAQADWISTLGELALSRPYVESICIQTLVDSPSAVVPFSGLLREDLTPKPAIERIAKFRQGMIGTK